MSSIGAGILVVASAAKDKDQTKELHQGNSGSSHIGQGSGTEGFLCALQFLLIQ